MSGMQSSKSKSRDNTESKTSCGQAKLHFAFTLQKNIIIMGTLTIAVGFGIKLFSPPPKLGQVSLTHRVFEVES